MYKMYGDDWERERERILWIIRSTFPLSCHPIDQISLQQTDNYRNAINGNRMISAPPIQLYFDIKYFCTTIFIFLGKA